MSKDDLVLLNQLAEDLMQTLSNDRAQPQQLEEVAKLQQAASIQDWSSWKMDSLKLIYGQDNQLAKSGHGYYF